MDKEDISSSFGQVHLRSLLTGLLYHHPEDPVSFLQSCLITIRQLGVPEAVTWDTFIHLERHQLSPGAPETTSVSPITSSAPPKATLTPPTTSPIPLITSSIPPQKTLIPPIESPQTPTVPQTTPPTQSPIAQTSTSPLTTPQTAPDPKFPLAPPEPAVTPSVQPEKKEQGDSKTFSTGGPPPGLPHSPDRSQLSIDSDSDMTESSGLLQEVKILPPQRPRPFIIFIIGGLGSGKGSQAARLARCFSFRVISLEEVFRRQLLSHASPRQKVEGHFRNDGSRRSGTTDSSFASGNNLRAEAAVIWSARCQRVRCEWIPLRHSSGSELPGTDKENIQHHFPLNMEELDKDRIGSPYLVMLLLCSNETLRCRLQRQATQLGLLGDSNHALQRRLETFQRDVVSVRYYRQLQLLTQGCQPVFFHLWSAALSLSSRSISPASFILPLLGIKP
ncbi:hypothetical protein L3Q82_023471 [Scortum barcoo]|uniref:Uncharacterized protein n=1 Tax=Scortum barcoo TaxID=214431 RepID=A0ACB8WZ22_9TELE|nr:hypothetical protein L3Q82_023471 [Scortum barcoo]